MPEPTELKKRLEEGAASFPHPIAAACRRYLAAAADPWRQWESLSRDALQSALHYLAHLLLSDLVALGQRPPHLYHRIQSILGRPMAGHYVGFLRETARYYREAKLAGAFPELIEFLLAAEVDASLLGDGRALLGLLVDYRNLWAHGKIDDPAAIERNVEHVGGLTERLLRELRFLERYPLAYEDGRSLMGSAPATLDATARPLVVITAGGRSLRPLLLKLRGADLVLLEEADVQNMKLGFRGGISYHRFTKKHLRSGDAARVFEELKDLLARVRSDEAVLPRPDWDSFRERASVLTDRTLSRYVDMRKYVPEWYVPRPEWEGEASVFRRFMDSDRTLLAISGVQGTGKSALVCRLANECRDEGNAVLFINAQRFTFADVTWSENPFPDYFARHLHYESGFDAEGLRRLVKSAPPTKRVVLFVDAINEVDGIETKWNRFRAMELMLEWICDVACPGLKIVLSFRLDAYEEFGYLERDEVPGRIDGVAWPGTNPSKRWVTDLVPFDDAQARSLYEKLQGQPQHGMAPAMAWPEIESGLGDELGEFSSNPLLFLVFLRSHHLATSVVTRDRDELFTRYAARLTGADEAAKRPWWRRMISFLIDGNVTRKERFLADMIDRMAVEGGAAFLVERLEPARNARDRRLAAAIDSPDNPAFVDLREGGLVAEEKIEVVRDGEETVTRRITFVGELMATAMRGVELKVRRFLQIRSAAAMAGLFSLACVGLLAAGYAASASVQRQIAARGIPPKVFADWVDYVLIVLALIAAGFIGAVFVYFTGPDPGQHTGDIGLAQRSYLIAADRSRLPIIWKVSALAAGPVLLVVFVAMAGSGGPHEVDLRAVLSPLVGLVVGALALLTPAGAYRLTLIGADRCPPRVVRSAHLRSHEAYRSAAVKGAVRRRVVRMLFAAAAFAPVSVYLALVEPSLGSGVAAVGARSLHHARALRITYASLLDLKHDSPAIVSVVAGIVIGGSIAADLYVYNYLIPHVHRRIGRDRTFSSRRRSVFVYAIALWLLAAAAFGVERGIAHIEHLPDDLGPLETLGVQREAIDLDRDGRVVGLRLRGVRPDALAGLDLTRYDGLVSLSLPADVDCAVDLSRLPGLQRLSAPARCVRHFDTAEGLQHLTLLDPGSWLADVRSRTPWPLFSLRLSGTCTTLGRLPAARTPVSRPPISPGSGSHRTPPGSCPPWAGTRTYPTFHLCREGIRPGNPRFPGMLTSRFAA